MAVKEVGALALIALCMPVKLDSASFEICDKATVVVEKSDHLTLCLVVVSKLG